MTLPETASSPSPPSRGLWMSSQSLPSCGPGRARALHADAPSVWARAVVGAALRPPLPFAALEAMLDPVTGALRLEAAHAGAAEAGARVGLEGLARAGGVAAHSWREGFARFAARQPT